MAIFSNRSGCRDLSRSTLQREPGTSCSQSTESNPDETRLFDRRAGVIGTIRQEFSYAKYNVTSWNRKQVVGYEKQTAYQISLTESELLHRPAIGS